MKILISIVNFLLIAVLLCGCKKEFLSVKPSDNIVVPETLDDFQALLDNDQYMNGGQNYGPDPVLTVIGADDYYINSTDHTALDQLAKSQYLWSDYIPFGTSDINWVKPYRVVFYANTVLEGLNNYVTKTTEQQRYDEIKGSALFYRSYQFFNLAQVFANQYNVERAQTDFGIPLRLTADISVPSTRPSLAETYDRINKDLTQAIQLLPNTQQYPTRPSKAGAYAMLSKVALTMGDYASSLKYADLTLGIKGELIDYNTVKGSSTAFLFPRFNTEVIFHSTVSQYIPYILSPSTFRIDSVLYASYSGNDLRKVLFFRSGGAKGGQMFRGNYSGLGVVFSGLATDEVYLTKAECLARLGRTDEAMETLNFFLINRYNKSSFIPMTATSADDALGKILTERRKELVMRSTRWSDLRRLNQEDRFQKTLARVINGQQFTLQPNSLKYTWPIPDDVVGLTNMPQNPR